MKKIYAVIISYAVLGTTVAQAAAPNFVGVMLDCCALALPCCGAGGCC